MCKHAVALVLLLVSPIVLVGCSGPGEPGRPDAATGVLDYPAAPKGDVVDDYHGVRVSDPYRWLEELDSPATRAWVAAQAELSSSYIGRVRGRARLRARLEALFDYERFGLPVRRGGRTFYSHNTGLQEQSVILMTDNDGGAPVVALDPNGLSGDGSLELVGTVLSPDGSLLAYGVSAGGSDWTEWRLRDLRSGAGLPDVLRNTKYYDPVFTADSKGIYYSAFPAPPPGKELEARDLGNALYLHVFGDAGPDRKVWSRPDHPDWQVEPHATLGGRYLVLLVGEGQVGDTGRMNVYVLDLAAPAPEPLPLVEGFPAAFHFVAEEGGELYFVTTLEAPRGRVVAIAPAAPVAMRFRAVVPEGPDAMDITGGSATLVGHRLLVRTLRDARTRVVSYGLDGKPGHEIALPGPGTVYGFDGEPGDATTYYLFADLVTPPVIFRYDVATGASTVHHAPKVKFDQAAFVAEQVFYPGKDGTRIPLFLAHKKGLALNGDNPTLLYGYGGFGYAVTPFFSTDVIAWLELGGVYAIAGIRGGGEYGEEWHRQATRTRKQTTFDDFIAAAEWLIAKRYTRPSRLAIEGASNGGLLVGACMTQRPDLFGAVLAEVGVMDMLRFDRFGQGAGWSGDYGSPADPEEFRALLAYSPYHNVRDGTRYPATWIVTGDHDTRVMPAHSFKFAAALQAAQAGPAPILLAVEISSGHGGGTTLSKAIEQQADAYAFLLANLGMSIE